MFVRGDQLKYVDVITCAAPNYSAAHRYQSIGPEENRDVLTDRIKFIKDVAEDRKVDAMIAGAFGCGVFGQNPEEVAKIFKETFTMTSVKKNRVRGTWE